MPRLAALLAPLLFALVLVVLGRLSGAQADPASPPDLSAYGDLLARAEAKSSARQWTAAAALWEQVVTLNPVNGRFWNQLATAHYNAKEYRKAIDAYRHVLELQQGFPSDAAYNLACCHALLGEKPQALQWLERAFDMGYRNLEGAQTDTDLQSLHAEARFRKIVGLVDVSTLSRPEGWRFDLQLLAREVKRKGYAPFRLISAAAFDKEVKRISDAVPHLTDAQITIEMMKLMRKIGDGHSGILGSAVRPDFLPALPVQFYLFEEGLYIIAADPKYKDLLGACVLRFGDRTTQEVLEALDPVISRDNAMWPKQVAPYRMRSLPLLHALGLVPNDRSVVLTLRDKEGKTRSVTLDTDTKHPDIWNILPNPTEWINLSQTLPDPLPLSLKNRGVNYWFEYLPERKTVYFQYNRVLNGDTESLAQFTERLDHFLNTHEVEKLVIDMRWNNGGDTFLNEPLLHELIRNEKIRQRGRFFVLIGRRTFSAAQNAVCYYERFLNPIFVGEPTGGKPNSAGEETIFTLPYSKLLANVSALYWEGSWPQDNRLWVAPHLYIPPTFAAYRVNRDPALEAALAYPTPK